MKVFKIKRLLVGLLAVLMIAACIPFAAGCGAGTDFVLNEEKTGYIMKGSGFKSSLSGELIIPEFYGEGEDRKPVTEIAKEAFRGAGYYSVVIPKTVEKIGWAAFANNNFLEKVTFAEGSPMKEVPQGTFGYCPKLKQVTLPQSCEVIGVYAFYGCVALEEITLPETVKEISAFAFASPQYDSLMSLKTINFPQRLEKIGERAFCYNGALKEIILPDSVKDVYEPVYEEDGVTQKTDATGAPLFKTVYAIGYGAFHSCFALEKAVLPLGVENIRSGVFGACSALKEVHFGANLKKVEGATFFKNSEGSLTNRLYSGHAFHNCTALTEVYFGGSEEQWKAVKVDNAPYSNEGVNYDNSAIVKATKHYGA